MDEKEFGRRGLIHVYRGLARGFIDAGDEISRETKKKIWSRVMEDSMPIEEMYQSFLYKPPTAHEDWNSSIANQVMGIISLELDEGKIPTERRQLIFDSIYESITGKEQKV